MKAAELIQNQKSKNINRVIVFLTILAFLTSASSQNFQDRQVVFLVSLFGLFLACIGTYLLVTTKEVFTLNIKEGDNIVLNKVVLKVKTINNHGQILLEDQEGKLSLVKSHDLFYNGFIKQ